MLLSIFSENPSSIFSFLFCFAALYFGASVIFLNNSDERKSNFYDQHRDGPVPTKEKRPL